MLIEAGVPGVPGLKIGDSVTVRWGTKKWPGQVTGIHDDKVVVRFETNLSLEHMDKAKLWGKEMHIVQEES